MAELSVGEKVAQMVYRMAETTERRWAAETADYSAGGSAIRLAATMASPTVEWSVVLSVAKKAE